MIRHGHHLLRPPLRGILNQCSPRSLPAVTDATTSHLGARAMSSESADAQTSALKCGSALRRVLDSKVIGQDDVKTGLLLALLSKEHAYIEGPPGVAKTYLAEILAESSGLSPFFNQLHRDTRLAELVGDPIIIREAMGRETEGELIRQGLNRGGLLQCQMAILDDITRAPVGNFLVRDIFLPSSLPTCPGTFSLP